MNVRFSGIGANYATRVLGAERSALAARSQALPSNSKPGFQGVDAFVRTHQAKTAAAEQLQMRHPDIMDYRPDAFSLAAAKQFLTTRIL